MKFQPGKIYKITLNSNAKDKVTEYSEAFIEYVNDTLKDDAGLDWDTPFYAKHAIPSGFKPSDRHDFEVCDRSGNRIWQEMHYTLYNTELDFVSISGMSGILAFRRK